MGYLGNRGSRCNAAAIGSSGTAYCRDHRALSAAAAARQLRQRPLNTR